MKYPSMKSQLARFGRATVWAHSRRRVRRAAAGSSEYRPRARQARERVLPGEGRDVEERRGAPGLPFVPGQALLEKRAGAKDQDLPAVARLRDGRRGGTCRTELPHLAPLATRVVRPEAD